ncbi:MAG: dockerin type I repeat-containing protein [Planctomycetaceae bacterium]|nr:dockerin type I repeat-containing protein [Planctomycetaceae bacterium]
MQHSRVASALLLALSCLGLPAGCATSSGERGVSTSSTAVPAAPTADGMTPPSGRDPATIPPPIEMTVGGPAVIGSTSASIFDSRTVAEPIDRRTFDTPQRRPGSLLPAHKKPPLAKGVPNDLDFAVQRPVARTEADPAFPAIGATAWTPPDPCLAVGPNHVVATVNMKVAWYLKDGTAQFENFLDSTGNPGFFEDLGAGNFTFDPKCFYDEFAQRFVVLALEYYSATQESWITFAVSDDADPNGVWFKYRTPSIVDLGGGCRYWVDYPGLGYDGQAWYVTGNLFKLSSSAAACGGFGGTLVRVIEKNGAMAGGTAVWRDVADPSASMQVATARDAADAARLVYVASDTTLGIVRVNNPLSAPVLSKSTCPVPLLVGDNNAPTPAGGLAIVDLRIFNAFVRDNRVFAAHHTASALNPSATAAWYEMNDAGGAPSLVQTGRISVVSGEHTFFPAVAVNDGGSVGLVYGRSSVAMNPRLEVAGRLPCDPPGTLGAATIVASSPTSPSGGSVRWGDYFALVVDPVDGKTFWGIGELQTAGGWRTEVVSFRVGRAADLDGDGAVNAGDLAVLLADWGQSGASDLNANGIVDAADLTLMLADWGPCVPQ